ncbi:MAG: hypothetical protein ACREPX_02285 [Rhodanobacteraceae bacterium]
MTTRGLFILACVMAGAQVPCVQAGTPAKGTAYIGAAFGTHNVYKVDYDYDGVGSMTATATILATLPTAADALIVPGGNLVVAGQGPNVYKVNSATGAFETMSANNNGNTVSLDPGGTSVWIGWSDSAPSQVPLSPFGNGTPHSIAGDDGSVTTLAFTPNDGVYYANGGEGLGNFGKIDLATFTSTRLMAATYATTVHYDRFSGSLVIAGLGRATQVDPSDPGTPISARDDTALGENYLMLRPDGRGHLFGTRWGGGDRLVLVDYSATGLIGDPSTIIVSASLVDGLSGGVAVDTSILADGFEAQR